MNREMQIPDYASRLKTMKELSKAARLITLPLFETNIEATTKSDLYFDPVTPADTACESRLRDIIQDTFPKDSLHGEEFDDVVGSSDWLWTMDPIDGTRAYIAGVPVWSTLIALSYKAIPIAGLIDFPVQNKCYWGTPERAWVEKSDGSVSDLSIKSCETLSGAVLGCTEPLAMFNEQELAAYCSIREKIRFSRLGLDSLGYALIAQGRMDVIIESKMKACDIRALIPIIEGAGGAVTSWNGEPAINGGQIIAVGDKRLLPELYGLLSPAVM